MEIDSSLEKISSDESDTEQKMQAKPPKNNDNGTTAPDDEDWSLPMICPAPPPPPILTNNLNGKNAGMSRLLEPQYDERKKSPKINTSFGLLNRSDSIHNTQTKRPIPLASVDFSRAEESSTVKNITKNKSPLYTPSGPAAAIDFGNVKDWLFDENGDETETDEKEGSDFENDIIRNENMLIQQQISDSPYWTQSIAPGKYYTRSRNGGQMATPALQALQKQFHQNVIEKIQTGMAAQPRIDPQSLSNFPHGNCTKCPLVDVEYGHSHDKDNSQAGSRSTSSDSENSSSSSDEEDSEKGGTVASSSSSEEDDLERNKRRSDLMNGRRRRRGRRRKQRQYPKNAFAQKEIERKRGHPASLHPDIGFNEPGQLNDGPQCKCSWMARQSGIRHGKYQGEKPVPRCNYQSSNIDHLYHYVLRVEPEPAQFSRQSTMIKSDGHCYQFDGFSVFFHHPLPLRFPQRPINQWTEQFEVHFVNENAPESFTVQDLELFHEFLFDQMLELYDMNRQLTVAKEALGDSCLFYHCLPRFARKLPDNGKELLPMSSILAHFNAAFMPLVDDNLARSFRSNPRSLSNYVNEIKGQICINPSKKPISIRVDLLDNPEPTKDNNFYPLITHFGVKPSAYAFLKKPQLHEALRKHMELAKKLIGEKGSKVKMTIDQRRQLRDSEANLFALKQECKSKRDTIIRLNSRDFYMTGIYSDVVQHALLLVLACQHVRFHCSLSDLEQQHLGYTFTNRSLLELALIHPSFRSNYGTNPDHAKNVLNNCGIRMGKPTKGTNHPVGNNSNGLKTPQQQPMDNKISAGNALSTPNMQPNSTGTLVQRRRKGIQMLMEVMAMQGSKQSFAEQPTLHRHNERMEFLGDAVVEFLTTVHLFFLFTELDEGGLATFRSALVQNRHLATLADRLGLQHFMVYAHGPDLCHEADLRHAMANTFESLMAAIFLDAGLAECDRIFAKALFEHDPKMLSIWTQLPEHPLKNDNPYGDRHLIESVPCLQHLTKFEQSLGIRFRHIRLLAKAFTRRNVPYNFLTLGHNQRLEFLGDTVLQLLTSDFLYKHFPHHQEGHLSLLRTCLVSNRTQSVVCDDLAMGSYLVVPQALLRKFPQVQLRVKDKADLVEAFLGALYVDRGLRYCRRFCRVCFFPRLKYFILHQRWNDPKSQLQQCCLALRDTKTGGDPEIPEYKTIGIEGPTNTRIYRVAVYFKNKRLTVGCGASVHLAQMQAAENALTEYAELFAKNGILQQKQKSLEQKKTTPSLNYNGNSNNRKRAYRSSFDGQNNQSSYDGIYEQKGSSIQRRDRANVSNGRYNKVPRMDNKLRRPSFNSSAENHISPSTSTSYPLATSASGVGTSNNTSTGNQAQKSSYWSPRLNLNAIQQVLQKCSRDEQKQPNTYVASGTQAVGIALKSKSINNLHQIPAVSGPFFFRQEPPAKLSAQSSSSLSLLPLPPPPPPPSAFIKPGRPSTNNDDQIS